MKLYKANELARILQVNPQTIYRLGARGEIKSVKVGRLVRFYMPTERREYGEEKSETESARLCQ